jgi:hypothetical protein
MIRLMGTRLQGFRISTLGVVPTSRLMLEEEIKAALPIPAVLTNERLVKFIELLLSIWEDS